MLKTRVISGYSITGIPQFQLEGGLWVNTTPVIAANIGCASKTVLMTASRSDRFSNLNTTNCGAKDHLQTHKAENMLKRVREDGRLWTTRDDIRFATLIHTEASVDIQDAMFDHIEQIMKAEYVSREVFDQLTEQLQQEQLQRDRIERRVSLLEKRERIANEARIHAQETASSLGKGLAAQKGTKAFRNMN